MVIRMERKEEGEVETGVLRTGRHPLVSILEKAGTVLFKLGCPPARTSKL